MKSQNSIKQIGRAEFAVPVGGNNVELRGPMVCGQWSESLKVLYSSASAQSLENFANYQFGYESNKAALTLQFAKRFGALAVRPEPGRHFEFVIDEPQLHQVKFRDLWRKLGRSGSPKHWRSAPSFPATDLENRVLGHAHAEKEDPPNITEEFQRLRAAWPGIDLDSALWMSVHIPSLVVVAPQHDRLLCGLGTLWDFLQVSLFSIPGERLRLCHDPNCKNPFFVAHHLKQDFCSEICAAWGKRQAALAWWNKRGKAARAKSSKRGGK